jgi:hypothetical protein
MKQSLVEYEQTEGKAEFFNSVGVQDVELESEKWDMGKEKFGAIVQDAKDYIDKLEEAIDEESKEIAAARKSNN